MVNGTYLLSFEIQDCQSRSGDESIILTNSDWQLHKLVENLDHAFLHGLRHITNGYWALVQDFTNKSTVKDINQLSNVTTNLGRGRAWLYQALNDQLLESYAKCYLDNQKLVKKFYVKEALVLDEQHLQILMTLVSGLEMTYFQLEVNMAYLDLATHMKQSVSDDSQDRISLSSLDSSVSQGSSIAQDPFDENNTMLPSRGQRSLSMDHMSSEKQPVRSSLSLPLIKADHLVATNDVNSDELESVEVIHLTSRPQKGHRKKTTKRKSDNNGDAVMMTPGMYSSDGDDRSIVSQVSSATLSPTTPESGYRSVVDHQSTSQPDSASKEVSVLDECLSELNLKNNLKGSIFEKDLEECCDKQNMGKDSESVTISTDSVECDSMKPVTPVNVRLVTDLNWTAKELQLVKCWEADNVDSEENIHSVLNSSSLCTSLASSLPTDSPCSVSSPSCGGMPSTDCDRNCEVFQDVSQSPAYAVESSVESSDFLDLQEKLVEQPQSIYDDDCDMMKPASESVVEDIADDSPVIKSNEMDIISNEAHSHVNRHGKNKRVKCEVKSRGKKDHDAEVLVDNNLMLLLMLEVFEVEDEKLIKMYQTCLGHTEGAVVPVYLLLTDAALYILTTQYGQKKFKKEGVVKYNELDYISLSLNYQIINVVCTNRRKQFWLTTGDEQLTRCIVSHLDQSLRKSNTALSILSVLTDATTQKIAIRKWLATECDIPEISEIQILHYNLISFEDLSNDDVPSIVPVTNKEGVLHYKTVDGVFFSGYWKEAYFVLKEGFLYQYNDRHDNQPPKLSIQLHQDECVGCRHCRHDDQQHCFEIILASGSTMQLSARSEKESREWLQSLCHTFSQSMGMSTACTGLLSCCVVVTNTCVVMFHEDVQTNFCRTLASAQLTDLLSVLIDPGAQIYIVMVFESSVSKAPNVTWVVYFNTSLERERFLTELGRAWSSLFHAKLSRSTLKDVKLRTRCRAGIGRLKKQRRV